MGRIKICQLITELRPAGAERCVFELTRRLNKDLFDVRVAALRGGDVADWLVAEGIPVDVLGVRGKWDVFKLRRLVHLLRNHRIDLLHTHLFHADLAGRLAASLAATPRVVHTVHVAESRFRPWQYAFARFVGHRCDRIVCVSHAVREHHLAHSGLPSWKYLVIPNGIDAAAYAHDAALRASLRRAWGLADKQTLIAMVGRLDVQKGLDVALSAASHLAARGEPVDLVLAGDGPQRTLVENFIAHGEGGARCRWLGHIQDVRGLLSAADLFIMPSRWEGFGLAAAEAMAAGLPVIATRVPGLAEVVIEGQTGLLIEKDDSFALTAAIETLLADASLRRRLGQAGRQRVMEHYDIAANIAAHEQLYRQLMG